MEELVLLVPQEELVQPDLLVIVDLKETLELPAQVVPPEELVQLDLGDPLVLLVQLDLQVPLELLDPKAEMVKQVEPVLQVEMV